MAEHNLVHLEPFEVSEFHLMSSTLRSDGAEHTCERVFALR